MVICQDCPDRARLRDLLHGALPDEEQADLTRHLDACAGCQQELEELAGGTDPWLGAGEYAAALRAARARAGAARGPEPLDLEPALRQAMLELRGDTDADALDDGPTDVEEGPPGFLSPSESPGFL